MKKGIVVLLSVTLLLSAVLSGSKAEAAEATKVQGPKKITVAQFAHLLIYYPIYLAKQKGYYEKNNLDVTFVSTGGDDKTFAAVSSGSALLDTAPTCL